MSSTLALLWYTGASLFAPESSQIEKTKILKPFFSPPIGAYLEVSRRDIINQSAQPLKIKGFIEVTPPKNSCFTIEQERPVKTYHVCKPELVPFYLSQLDQSGRIVWKVIQGDRDQGTFVYWPTPYRLARVIPLGDFSSGMNQLIPTARCIVEKNLFQRKVTLELMNGKNWSILFPDQDVPFKDGPPEPNLYIRELTSMEEPRGKRVERDKEPTKPQNEAPSKQVPPEEKQSFLAMKLSGRLKDSKKDRYVFKTKESNSFYMRSDRLLEDGTPKGLNGECRYRYQGAPNDPNSGVIECFKTESYDAIYVHLTCSRQLISR